VILLTIDTLRADRVGVYGGPAGVTPTLDALAARGVTFLDATAHVPLTLPSHVSLLSGRYPPRHGVRDNQGFTLRADARLLAEILRASGYHTAAVIASFVLNRSTGLARGFAEYNERFAGAGRAHVTLSDLERRGPEIAREAAKWVSGAQEPFFLWVHLYDPHAPYDPPRAFASRFPSRPYEGEIATSDWSAGEVLAAVPAPVRARTFVIATSDHGESLGDHGEAEHGMLLYDSTLHVPLIIAGPELPAALRVAQQVRLVDVAPTILELLHVPREAGMDGTSFMNLVRGTTTTAVPSSYAETAYGYLHFGWSELRSVRDGDWKYIDAPRPELYDLRRDPAETRNLHDARPQSSAALSRQLPASAGAVAQPAIDSATLERLRSLGYTGGTGPVAGMRRSGSDDPKDHIAEYVAYTTRFNEALRALESDRADAALVRFRALSEKFPASFEAHQYVGRALSALGRQRAALAEYGIAIRLNPGSAILYFDAARALSAAGEFQRAFDHVKEGLRLEPESFYGRLTEGFIAEAAGQEERAVTAFRAALQMNPDLAVAQYELGVIAERQGRTQEAIERYRGATAADPELRPAWQALRRLEGR
jgi:arylsulfatase A-like enzyme/Tfp pilus assembly protein PilF